MLKTISRALFGYPKKPMAASEELFLAAAKELKAQKLQKALQSGKISVNEARKENGLGPIEGGDVKFIREKQSIFETKDYPNWDIDLKVKDEYIYIRGSYDVPKGYCSEEIFWKIPEGVIVEQVNPKCIKVLSGPSKFSVSAKLELNDNTRNSITCHNLIEMPNLNRYKKSQESKI